QPRDRARLGQEPLAARRVGVARADQLDRDGAVEHRVVPEVDLAHPTPAERAYDPELLELSRSLYFQSSGVIAYRLSLVTNVRSGIWISSAARFCTPLVAASASTIRLRSSSRISSSIGRNERAETASGGGIGAPLSLGPGAGGGPCAGAPCP